MQEELAQFSFDTNDSKLDDTLKGLRSWMGGFEKELQWNKELAAAALRSVRDGQGCKPEEASAEVISACIDGMLKRFLENFSKLKAEDVNYGLDILGAALTLIDDDQKLRGCKLAKLSAVCKLCHRMDALAALGLGASNVERLSHEKSWELLAGVMMDQQQVQEVPACGGWADAEFKTQADRCK